MRGLLTASVGKPGPPLTCSIGVASAHPPPASTDPVEAVWKLAAQADRALYQAKTQGRDRVVSVFDPVT